MVFIIPGTINIDVGGQLRKLYEAGNIKYVTNLGEFVSRIVSIFLTVAAIATFLYLVLAGLQWIFAGSDKGKVEEARNRITNAVIGLAIVAASWAIFLLLNYFFGLDLV